jgi:adenylate cyclase
VKPSRRTLVPMVVGALCGLVTWLFAQIAFFRGMEEWLQDSFFAYRGTRATSTKVIVVGLDEDSLEDLPKPLTAISPELAEVITYLNARKAAAIGLDFQIPDRLDAYDREKDLGGRALGAAACAAGNVVLPLVLGDDGRPVPPLTSWRFCLDPGPGDSLPQLALVDRGGDDDEIVRHFMIAETVDGRPYDSLPVAVLRIGPKSDGPARAGDDGNSGLISTDRSGSNVYVDYQPVPLDAANRLRINYVGPPGTIPHVSFRDVLAAARAGGKAPALADKRHGPVDFEGAIVLVGATAHSLGDHHATPYTNGTLLAGRGGPRLMSGTELLANVVATLKDRAFITTPWLLVSLPWVVLAGAALGFAYGGMTLRQGLVLCVVHHFAWKALARAAFCLASWRVEVGAMLTTGVVAYGVTFALRWKRLRAGMFGVVKGKLLAGLLEGGPDDPALRPVERGISVLFADVRGFTRWSHGHTPTEVVALLNAYFEAIIPPIEAQGGIVDKYIGDGIMVLFGVPDERPDHAERALRAAVAVIARVHELAPTWARHDFPGFGIGVGVATGAAVVGMVGSRQRLDYTAIGDTVNAAARIESANKELGTEVLVSARTRNAVGEELFVQLGGAGGPTTAAAHGLPDGLTVYRVDVPAGPRPAPGLAPAPAEAAGETVP